MPVARIITRSPELSENLANELRARGYSVETVPPEQAGGTPAELEIIFHTCAVQEVLGRVAELAQASEADVYIARDVCRGLPEAVDDESTPVPASSPGGDEAPRTQAAAAPVAHPEPTFAGPRTEGTERDNLIRDLTVVAGRTARNLAERWGAAMSAMGRQITTLASGFGARISERRKARQQQRTQAQQQQLLLRQQRRQRELREQERRQIPQGQPTAAPVGAARSNVLWRTGEVLGRAAGNLAGQLGEAVFALAQQVSEWRITRRQRALASAPRLRRRAADRLPVIRRTRERDDDWKTAAVFAGLLAIAVMVAWAAANRRPASPLPTSVLMKSNSMEQQIPFGPVTLRPSTLPPKSSTPMRPKPSPQKFSRAKAAPPRTSAAAAPAQRAQDSAEKEEVVVRHFFPAATTARTAQASGSIRRYSDDY